MEHSTWNPIIHIDNYRIVDDQQISDYENIFMATYLIKQENYYDKLSSQSKYELLDNINDNNDSSNVETLIRQFQSKSNNNNNNSNNNNSNSNNSNNSNGNNNNNTNDGNSNNNKTNGNNGCSNDNNNINCSNSNNSNNNSSNNKSNSNGSYNNNEKNFIHDDNETKLISNNKEKHFFILYSTNQKINNKNEKLKNHYYFTKKLKQLEIILNELSLDRYTQKYIEGLQRVDLKCEKLEYMMKTMKDTLSLKMATYQKHKKKLDNEIIKKCRNFSMKEFKDISKETTLSSDVAKQFTNSLKTILGRKQYFQIIKTFHLENLYNQMSVSQRLAQTTFKQWKKLREEKHTIELHSEYIRLKKNNKIHHNLWKYDIPDTLKILEIFTGWYLNISLFIVLAALAERFYGLESIIGNNVHKIGTQSLYMKIRKARELFILIGGLDRKQYFQQSYVFEPIIKLRSNETTNNLNPNDGDPASSICFYNKSTFQKSNPFGHIEVKDLKVFFHAANISQVHVQELITSLDHKKNGTIDFVTFLEYLPFFVESHQHIIYNPYLNKNIFNV
uniref:EF-hand domain-containing protein n=1 Tax=Schistosoma mansoni TaxID=6183 RepID=A0A5K4FDL7_SCHMA